MRVRVPPSAPWALLALLLAGCDRRPDSGPVLVSVIGSTPTLANAARRSDEPSRVLAGAVAQGLVRFDATGQIEPGIAERWTVIDNGTSYIFRLREARWAGGGRVTSAEVAAGLRHQLGRTTHNPLAPFLSAVTEVVEMTPEVIEVRLSRPRPDLLKLFAEPELALVGPRGAGGTGPFRPTQAGHGVLLHPARDEARGDDDAPAPTPEDDVRLSGERAAVAIARFVAHRSDLVTGGDFDAWPLLDQVRIAQSNLRIDPAAGLFGLAIVTRDGFLGDPSNRAALAASIDRQAIAQQFGGWTPADTIVPDRLDSAEVPASSDWSTLTLEARRVGAQALVQAWRSQHPEPLVLRIALPVGPGATLLWGHVASALLAIGITPVRVLPGSAAELRLVDAVAPYDSARWYLATACQPCGAPAQAALDAAREAPTLATRAQALALADRAVAADTPFILIARPLRWSLVAFRLPAWQPNARAWHPLNHLRNNPT